jgi:hypothetical protein
VILKLSSPVAHGSVTVTELNFREKVVAGDLRGVPMRDPMHFDDILKIAGRLCAQPDPVMNALSIEDAMGVVETVGGFIGASQKTGKEPSP